MSATTTSGFFQTGGTLSHDAPSYVWRAADDELYAHLMAGRYCYVLTSRQRGKSSLMVRTAERLRQAGIVIAVVDLSAIGTDTNADAWYFGIITRLTSDLKLSIDIRDWWHARAALGPVQRLNQFLDEVVLPNIASPMVIFFDEIDTTLKIDFSDDFFAAIRQLYNLRASNAAYDRITFALLGVATPTDLIKDPNRTPFNIGRAVRLGEFRRTDATALEMPLDDRFPGYGSALLDRIFFWTGGHPYLTQQLCQKVTELSQAKASDTDIDTTVQQIFFGEVARVENNLSYIQSSVEERPAVERRAILALYRQLRAGVPIDEDQRSPLQARLRLIGLARAENGRLEVRNQIYRRIFDDAWARKLTPIDWTRWIIMWSVAVIVLALIVFSFLTYRQAQEKNRIALIGALSQRCGLPDQRASAIDEFLKASPATQLSLLENANADAVWERQKALAHCIEPALSSASNHSVIHQICFLLSADSDRYQPEVDRTTGTLCDRDDRTGQ